VRRRLHAERVLTAEDPIAWVGDRDADGRLTAQRGESFTLVLAMGDTPVRLPEGRLLLASDPGTDEGRLPPDTAAWLLRWLAAAAPGIRPRPPSDVGMDHVLDLLDLTYALIGVGALLAGVGSSACSRCCCWYCSAGPSCAACSGR